MLTASAARAVDSLPADLRVTSRAALRASGWTPDAVRAQLRAGRWQRAGLAIVLHNGMPDVRDRQQIALVNCGPHAVLTAFTAAELHGLRSWTREPVHVLVPAGTHVRHVSGHPLRLHWTTTWDPDDVLVARRLHRVAPSLVLAASTFSSARPACGILAAGVQQRLVTVAALIEAVRSSPRVRHRRVLLGALHDIAGGAHALSEIDFARLCRRAGLPEPERQRVRVERDGRRRYLDAEWLRPDGRRVVAEVDGALHLAARQWWDDQSRQNELLIAGDLVLRFPSVVLRTDEPTVVRQLRAMLLR